MNAIEDNTFTRALRMLGQSIAEPPVVLVVSAHWLTPRETRVSSNPTPATIHDFGGFPDELFQIHYPAPGAPAWAVEVVKSIRSLKAVADPKMGLDHGAWTVLRHIWPHAHVPVFQLSIDFNKPPQFHYDLGRELRPLRDQGLLILGSGNIVHNLGKILWEENAPAYDWAATFDTWSKDMLLAANHQTLIDYDKQGDSANMAVPTNDHYLPLLYVLGCLYEREKLRFVDESIQNGSISMRSFVTE
jgi:4,5-DOPA dioxygenase extradiol